MHLSEAREQSTRIPYNILLLDIISRCCNERVNSSNDMMRSIAKILYYVTLSEWLEPGMAQSHGLGSSFFGPNIFLTHSFF